MKKFLGLALLACAMGSQAAWAAKKAVANSPGLGLVHQDSTDNPEGWTYIAVTGSSFGNPAANASLRLMVGANKIKISSQDAAQVVLWTPRQIVIRWNQPARPTQARVTHPGGFSKWIPIEYYSYEHFDVPNMGYGNPHPLAVTVDQEGRPWNTNEFGAQINLLENMMSVAVPIPYSTAKPFTSLVFKTPSPSSDGDEDMEIDPSGRIWFTQGGGDDSTQNPNHSRIASFLPTTREFKIYNVPGDRNGIIGLSWDQRRNRIWYAQKQRKTPGFFPSILENATLVSFNPDHIAPDNQFDFMTDAVCEKPAGSDSGTCSNASWKKCLTQSDCVLAHQFCRPNASDDSACFRRYELPQSHAVYSPAHILAHSDGSIWMTGYWGSNSLSRLNPQNSTFNHFPLGHPLLKNECDASGCDIFCTPDRTDCTPCTRACFFYKFFGSGPWEIKEARNGRVAFTEYFNSAIGSIPGNAYFRSECQTLNSKGRNPCMKEIVIPGSDPHTDQVHSMTVDRDGRSWFTQSSGKVDPQSKSSVGFANAKGGSVVTFPPLSLYPFFALDATYVAGYPAGTFVSFHGAGIAADPQNGTIWFADYFRKRLGKMTRLGAQ